MKNIELKNVDNLNQIELSYEPLSLKIINNYKRDFTTGYKSQFSYLQLSTFLKYKKCKND